MTQKGEEGIWEGAMSGSFTNSEEERHTYGGPKDHRHKVPWGQ